MCYHAIDTILIEHAAAHAIMVAMGVWVELIICTTILCIIIKEEQKQLQVSIKRFLKKSS